MENEIWEVIVEFPQYAISNFGRCKKVEFTKGGYGAGRFLKPKKQYDGYLMFRASKNGKQYFLNAHRTVAKYFIPNPEQKQEVNHKNLMKDDNRVGNLEWVTPKENIRHARSMRTWKIPVYTSRGMGIKRRTSTRFSIEGFSPGMTMTKDGKKEYMKQYRKQVK